MEQPLSLSETFFAVLSSRDARTRTLLIVTAGIFVLMVLELFAGARLNSVGLLADALHNLFHCVALCVSLWGVQHARRSVSGGAYTYGFSRFEVLAAFSNATLLIFMQLFLVAGVVHRLIEPANFMGDVASGRIKLALGAAGVVLNVWAVFALGGRTSSLLAKGSRAGSGVAGKAGGRDAFTMQLYSDAFSSLLLIISAFAAPHIGTTMADIAQAALSAGYTLSLVVPLAMSSAECLLQSVPPATVVALDRIRREALAIDGVLDITSQHFWVQAPGHGVCTVTLRVRHEANSRDVLAAAQRVYARVATDLTVQIEKDAKLDDWRELAAGMGIVVQGDAASAGGHSGSGHAHAGGVHEQAGEGARSHKHN